MTVEQRISLLSLYEVQQNNPRLFKELGVEVVVLTNDDNRPQ